MKKNYSLIYLTLGVLAFLAIPSVAHAQATPAPAQNLTAFMVLLPGIIALSTQMTTALRDALSAPVPPVWFTSSPKLRPWVAAVAGAVVAFLGALSAAEATGGEVMSRAMLLTAALAAMTNLGITLPKLIYTEKTAVAVASNAAKTEELKSEVSK